MEALKQNCRFPNRESCVMLEPPSLSIWYCRMQCVVISFLHFIGSPFSCSVSEAARVILSSEDKVSVDKPAKFIIECEPAMGTPMVQVLSPNRTAVPVQVIPLDTGGKYSAQFIPKDVGKN